MKAQEAGMGNTGAGSRVPAAEHTLAILRFLAQQSGPVPATAVTRALDLPRSTTYHLLAVLLREGFVVHLPEERRYGLGVGTDALSKVKDAAKEAGTPWVSVLFEGDPAEAAAAASRAYREGCRILTTGNDRCILTTHFQKARDLLAAGLPEPATATAP